LWLGQYIHYHTTSAHLIWSIYWSWRVHGNQAHVAWPWPHFHGLLTLLNLYQVFMIRSVSVLSNKHRFTIFGPHFDDGGYSFMVPWFSLFSEKYFTLTICSRQTRQICPYLFIILIRQKKNHQWKSMQIISMSSCYERDVISALKTEQYCSK
jgi:hypothetical protein